MCHCTTSSKLVCDSYKYIHSWCVYVYTTCIYEWGACTYWGSLRVLVCGYEYYVCVLVAPHDANKGDPIAYYNCKQS